MSSLFGIAGGGNVGAAGGDFYSYSIDQSLRFNDTDDHYLNRVGTTGDRQKWTWSGWVKRSTLGNINAIFSEGTTGSSFALYFWSDNTIYAQERNSSSNRFVHQTSAVFRDVGAWMHICYAVDTTQATDADRVNLYVNGVEQSIVAVGGNTLYPSLNLSANINFGGNHSTGYAATNSFKCFDGYMAEVHFVDGQQLNATDFAEEKNGIWVPKQVSGMTYGTNGYYLTFSSDSFTDNASDPDVFADQAGSNNHNAYNFAASDIVPDSPTNNFATLSPLHTVAGPTLSEGNLKLVGSGTDYDRSYATFGLTSGKWYAEFRYLSGDNRGMFGIVREDSTSTDASNVYIGSKANQYGLDFRARSYSNNVELFDTTDFSTGDIGLLCFDIDNGKIYFGRRDISGATTIWYDSAGANNGNPSAGTNPTYTGTFTGHTWFIGCHDYNGTNIHTNFGADGSFSDGITSGGLSDANGIGDFNYIEDGFLALCSANLPEPTISPNSAAGQADDYFDTVLWTGNGTSPGDAQEINGLSFQPDFVWVKGRSGTQWHELHDSVRGVGKRLFSNETSAETDVQSMTSFDNDGFTVAIGTAGNNGTNENGSTYVGWSWKAGGTASTIAVDAYSAGVPSTASSVSANQDAGFSILTYTADAATGTVGHGLNSAPELILGKPRNEANTNWYVMHTPGGVVPANNILNLDSTNAAFNPGNNHFNDTYPTDTVVSYGGYMGNPLTGDDKLMYCFHSVDGFSKVGSYVGNGSTDGVFVFTNFEVKWLMVKRTDSSSDWVLWDAKRDPYNYVGRELQPDKSDAELSYNEDFDLLANGFKARRSAANFNATGGTYIYLAFAEAPFKYANAR